MSLPFDKSSIRTTLLRQRECLTRDQVQKLSAAAQAQLLAHPAFMQARTLALYSPIRNEVETGGLLAAALTEGKRVCFPCVVDEHLYFYQVLAQEELQAGCFGVCEPDRRADEIDSGEIDLLLIPGVAFDRQGFRLGYGRGYFDRMLGNGNFSGLRVGFGYDFQLVDALPAEIHDQRIELLVTEKGIYSPSEPF